MMKDSEIQIEKEHRRDDFLGMRCQGSYPTPADLGDAAKCAREWETRYRAAAPEDREP